MRQSAGFTSTQPPNGLHLASGDGPSATVGVIGGTGLYDLSCLTDVIELEVDTPFGPPSDLITVGQMDGAPVAFLPRHGRSHHLLPGEIPQRANIWAMASLGVRHLISVSAVGSLREEIEPRHVVIPDQLIDRTSGMRPATFFGRGVVCHVGFEAPFCSRISHLLGEASRAGGATAHEGGMMIVIEGPAFSTRAESQLHRSWGASVVGMTLLPEAKLAREAGMCYASLAIATDYDAWHTRDHVSVDLVMDNLRASASLARNIVERAVEELSEPDECDCCESLGHALLTPMADIPPAVRQELAPILTRYARTQAALAS